MLHGIGGNTVRELEHNMSVSEFADWVRYYDVEPFGPLRDNEHTAQIAAILSNIHKQKSARIVEVEDFMIRPAFEKEEIRTRRAVNALLSMAEKKK